MSTNGSGARRHGGAFPDGRDPKQPLFVACASHCATPQALTSLTVRAFADSLNLTQTTVALLALAAVTILVVAHHRTQGQFLTQTQEEMVLIGAFGLFWLALLVTLRVIRQRGGEFAGHDVPPGGYRQTVAKPVGKAGGGKARQEWAGYGYGYQPAYTVEEYEYW